MLLSKTRPGLVFIRRDRARLAKRHFRRSPLSEIALRSLFNGTVSRYSLSSTDGNCFEIILIRESCLSHTSGKSEGNRISLPQDWSTTEL
ncbi:hypothetical protein BC826DRAFT_38996 [Russula brevipes]|nr:hypothetical protein BC826DRAFT_38996 [Russula brevipes]